MINNAPNLVFEMLKPLYAQFRAGYIVDQV